MLGFWIASVLATATWISVRSADIQRAFEAGDTLRSWSVNQADDWIRGNERFVPSNSDVSEALLGAGGPDSLALNLHGQPIVLGFADVIGVDYRAPEGGSLTILAREAADGPLLRAPGVPLATGSDALMIDLGELEWSRPDGKAVASPVRQLSQIRLLWTSPTPVAVSGVALSAPHAIQPQQRLIEMTSLFYPLRSLELAKTSWVSAQPVIPVVPGGRWFAEAPLFWMVMSVLIGASAPIAWLRNLEPGRFRVPLWVVGVLCVLTITPDLTRPPAPVAVALIALAIAGMVLGWRRSPPTQLSFGSREAWRASAVFVLFAAGIAAVFWLFYGAEFSPKTIWRYLAWACLQQWLLSRVLLVRGNDAKGANACAGALFGLLHWPSLPLMTLTAGAGWYWARLHQRGDALVPATLSHAIAGWLILSTLPNWVGVSGEVGMRYFG